MTGLRFGIRDMFWVIVVTGLAVGWWSDRQQSGKVAQDALNILRHDESWRAADLLHDWLEDSGTR